MKQRLFRSILLLTGAAVGLVLLLFFWVSCQYITQDSFASLKREANLLIVADGEGNVPVSELQRLQLTDRVTLITPDGHALYDNYADAESMENHLQREEVQEALKGGEGRSGVRPKPWAKTFCTMPCACRTAMYCACRARMTPFFNSIK